MRGLIYLALGISAILAALPAFAQAQGCIARAQLVEALRSGFGEEVTRQALTSSGQIVEFAEAESGAWTLFITLPSGMSCPMAAGTGVIDLTPVTGDPA